MVIHLTWSDNRDGNLEIYYKRSQDGGLSWGADTRLTNAFGDSHQQSLVSSGTVVHIVWTDLRDGNSEIYYKRDPTGNQLGLIPISSNITEKYLLEQNYPNPFNPATKIRFQIPLLRGVDVPSTRDRRGVFTRIIVYDVLGRKVTRLVNETLQPGTYEVEWEAVNFPSGVYLYRIISGAYTETKKMILLK